MWNRGQTGLPEVHDGDGGGLGRVEEGQNGLVCVQVFEKFDLFLVKYIFYFNFLFRKGYF